MPTNTTNDKVRKNYYNGAIIFIAILFCVVTTCFCWRMFAPRPQVNQIVLEMKVYPDSVPLNEINASHVALADSISNIINEQDQQLNEHYQLFIKAREDDADLIKILSYVAAFMAAIFAIIGIKSFKDLKERVEENTKELAKQTATETARLHLQRDIRSEIQESINNDMFFRDMKSRIMDAVSKEHLVDMEDRISSLEKENKRTTGRGKSATSPDGPGVEIEAPLSAHE